MTNNKAYAVKETKPDLAKLNSWWSTVEEYHKKKHWEWFVIDQFLRGNHDIRGNVETNAIEIVKKQEAVNFPINKVYATFRAVRSFVTRHKPIVAVDPENDSDSAKNYARRATKILERDNRLNNFRKINKEWAYFGIKYGVGYRQVNFDPYRRCAIRWTIDPNDLWSGDPYGEIEDAPFLIKTVRRTLGYLKAKYPKFADKFVADNLLAADQYKRLGYEIIYGQTDTQSISQDEQTQIVKECWYRVYKQNKNGGYINKCTFIENDILDHEETAFTEYPFIPYKSDIVPNESTGEGHLKHIVSPQRMLDLLNTQLLEYNHIVNKGRYITEKNSGFKIISTKQGQIIQVNAGKRVDVLNPASLSPLLKEQILLATDWIEDIGGQHDASYGQVPNRVTSGVAIEALQLGDSNNIADVRDNFEDSLETEAAWILRLYSLFEDKGFKLSDTLKDNQKDEFYVMGKLANEKTGYDKEQIFLGEDNGGYYDVFNVLPDNQVKVSITSQLGETKQARLDLLFKLVEYGLPLKVVLEHLEFPNTSDILERIAQEALAENALQMMGQNQQQNTESSPTEVNQEPADTSDLPLPPEVINQ